MCVVHGTLAQSGALPFSTLEEDVEHAIETQDDETIVAWLSEPRFTPGVGNHLGQCLGLLPTVQSGSDSLICI